MATCPYCGRFLSAQHRCHGKGRLWARRATVAVAGALAGVSIPLLFSAYVGTPLAFVVAGLLGALLASAIWEGFR